MHGTSRSGSATSRGRRLTRGQVGGVGRRDKAPRHAPPAHEEGGLREAVTRESARAWNPNSANVRLNSVIVRVRTGSPPLNATSHSSGARLLSCHALMLAMQIDDAAQ